MTNNLIYIAGPIMNGHEETDIRKIWKNIENGKFIYMTLVERGWTPILPHFSFYSWVDWPRDIPWQTWVKMDESYVEACDYFYYMAPSQYGPSKGALREYQMAKKLNKQIFTDIDLIPEYEIWKNLPEED